MITHPPANTSHTPEEKPTVVNLDVLFDIDQPREHDPSGDWTKQRYIGERQYDKMFLELKNRAPESPILEPPKGPLGAVDRIELWTGEYRHLTRLTTLDHGGFTYHVEGAMDFADDRGSEMFTAETMRIPLGAAATYVPSAHPFLLVVRGRNKDGALVFEQQLGGDEADEYMRITPPRPY